MEKVHRAALGSLLGLGILTPLVTGCASDNLNHADQNYGNSVRSMIALQTAQPARGATGLDGEKAAKALEAYRKDVAKPEEVDQEQLTAVTGVGGG